MTNLREPLSNYVTSLINITLRSTHKLVTRLLHFENYLRIITGPYQIMEALNIVHKCYKHILNLLFFQLYNVNAINFSFILTIFA